MKIKQVGQKPNAFRNYIGSKIYGGIKAVGQKTYDNRYKILLGAGLLIGGGLLANSYGGANISPETVASTGASIAPSLSDTLRAQGKFKMSTYVSPPSQYKLPSNLPTQRDLDLAYERIGDLNN